jgi:hypothetical protein
METILFSSNANIVAIRPNGFVGETPIFVNHATKSNVKEIT